MLLANFRTQVLRLCGVFLDVGRRVLFVRECLVQFPCAKDSVLDVLGGWMGYVLRTDRALKIYRRTSDLVIGYGSPRLQERSFCRVSYVSIDG